MSNDKFIDSFRDFTFSIPWNLGMITLGAAIIAFAVKAMAVQSGFLTGGMSGLALLVYYIFPVFSPGVWYFILNVPVFIIGWVFVSPRFFFYSLYGMAVVSFFVEIIDYTVPIQDPWLLMFTCGTIMGIGVGISMRSLGSTGGVDILAVLCREKFNMSIGTFDFLFNLSVFSAGFLYLDLRVMLLSTAMAFITSWVTDYCIGLFTERNMVMVISDKPQEILDAVLVKLDRGATLLKGQGGYSKDEKQVVMTMINSVQIKRLEELIYEIDTEAFTIMGSGFHVLGRGFSSRKVY